MTGERPLVALSGRHQVGLNGEVGRTSRIRSKCAGACARPFLKTLGFQGRGGRDSTFVVCFFSDVEVARHGRPPLIQGVIRFRVSILQVRLDDKSLLSGEYLLSEYSHTHLSYAAPFATAADVEFG